MMPAKAPFDGCLISVFLVYFGLALLLVGAASLVRPLRFLRITTRRLAALVFTSGLALAGLGAGLPAPLHQAAIPRTRLDDLMPLYQFHEVHSIRVRAPPDRAFQAIKAVTPGEIRFYGVLTWIRSPRFKGGGREGLLNAPPSKPILETAQAGFLLLADEPDRELVLGAAGRLARAEGGEEKPLTLGEVRAAVRSDPQAFARFNRPHYVKIALNFLVEDEGNGWCRVGTETRVFATSPQAERAFAIYWRMIYPGSALIRRMWLEAIKRRAERS